MYRNTHLSQLVVVNDLLDMMVLGGTIYLLYGER